MDHVDVTVFDFFFISFFFAHKKTEQTFQTFKFSQQFLYLLFPGSHSPAGPTDGTPHGLINQFVPCQSINSGGRGLGRRRRHSSEETTQGSDGFQRPAAVQAGEKLPEAKVPERPGPHGAGSLAAAQRHPGQDLVPEPEVRTPQRFGCQVV